MKTFSIFLITVLLTVTACQASGNAVGVYTTGTAAALDNQAFVATMVAQTLTAIRPVSTSTPLATMTSTATFPPLQTCEGSFFGIQITLPNDTWTCSVNQDTFNGQIIDEPFNITSPLFTIYISNGGRGPYCGEEPDSGSCVVTDFYKNQYVSLVSYSLDGKLGEIFGLIAHRAWISIKYQGMESRDLNISEKLELTQLIDSIKFIASTAPKCEGQFTGIQVAMPNLTWTCTVIPYIENGKVRDESFYIVSPLYEVTMSYVGRGYGCEEIKVDPNSSCEVTEFYSSAHMTIQKYVVDGQNSEIFGVTDQTMLVDGGENRIWISIRYDGMGARDLNPAEMQELVVLLDSIRFTK